MFKILSGRRKKKVAATEAAPAPGPRTGKGARFAGGRNIALKLPAHQFDATVAFYRDVLLLPVETSPEGATIVEFGEMRLWLDRSESLSQAELWLQVLTDDVRKAADTMARSNVVRCDEIEKLPRDFRGFWVMNPAGIVHLVAEPGQDGGD